MQFKCRASDCWHLMRVSAEARIGTSMQDSRIQQLLDKPAVGQGTPLFISSQNGHSGVVRFLLKMRADYRCMEDGSSPLLVAAQNGHLPVVKLLWEHLGEDAGLNRRKRGGATPLYVACKNGHLDVVQNLIDLRADINKSLQTLETPLFTACQGGFRDVVEVLVQAGAEVNEARQDGATPLLIAAQQGSVHTVSLLCESLRKPDEDKANTDATWWHLGLGSITACLICRSCSSCPRPRPFSSPRSRTGISR